MTELTELERLKMENFNLRLLFMQQQIQHLQTERAVYISQLEMAHPGFEWDDQRGLVQREEIEALV